MRLLFGLGLLVGGVLLGLSCSGAAPEVPTAAEPGARVYHVQRYRTEHKATANRMLGRALEWGEERAGSVDPRPLPTASSPASVAWRAPLYRVRLGPFGSRRAADSVLPAAQPNFPEAFVRPERVPAQP
jgi:hypothetical protein